MQAKQSEAKRRGRNGSGEGGASATTTTASSAASGGKPAAKEQRVGEAGGAAVQPKRASRATAKWSAVGRSA